MYWYSNALARKNANHALQGHELLTISQSTTGRKTPRRHKCYQTPYTAKHKTEPQKLGRKKVVKHIFDLDVMCALTQYTR